MSRDSILCGRCGTAVTPGLLFCWHHESAPPKVGEFSCEDGQLRWMTARDCKGSAERLLAVTVDGQQVVVEFAREAPAERPRRIELEVREPGKPNARPTSVSVALPALFATIQAGDEVVAARPTSDAE